MARACRFRRCLSRLLCPNSASDSPALSHPIWHKADIFASCVHAVEDGILINSVSATDKEFHFQNWFRDRLTSLPLHFDAPRRNAYPDFAIVDPPEGYEIKGLAWPGRERDYDANSQIPTGYHNGRHIFYVFGRYPANGNNKGTTEYPVVDMVICHGDFLNADHTYIHKNKHVKGFGSYGDIMIRDRKMYVAPTPFALTSGTTGLMTVILPEDFPIDGRFREVGNLVRIEAKELVVAYKFDLRSNTLTAEMMPNPDAGKQHSFIAYRLTSQSTKPVSLIEDWAHVGEHTETEDE